MLFNRVNAPRKTEPVIVVNTPTSVGYHIESAMPNGELFKFPLAIGGVLSDVTLFVDECKPAIVELQVLLECGKEQMVFKRNICKGNNVLDTQLEILAGTRCTISLTKTDIPELELRGLWLTLVIKSKNMLPQALLIDKTEPVTEV